MKTYRDYLDHKEIPRGPWCVLELNNPIVKGSKLWHNLNKESRNVSNRPIIIERQVIALPAGR
jgi:hypothetical protein